MYDDEFKLVIASILHDIGKIEQRIEISEKHAELGYKFINNNVFISDKKAKDEIADLVKYHHTNIEESEIGENLYYLLNILKTADRKSAAHDREDKDGKINDVRLEKISNLINFTGNNTKENYYKLSTLDKTEEPSLDTGYKTILKLIKNDIGNIEFDDINYNVFNSLNTVLFKDTIFVPSAFYYSNPNISLYHHLKLTAAIALSIYRHNKIKNNKNLEEDDKKFILLMCNLSGIQKYIFRYFKSESADSRGTKRLKGRSFMIKLVTDSIQTKIMEELNLYRINTVWEKSDGFMMLFENSEETLEKLESIKKEINKGLMDKRRGISAAISWVEASLCDFITINNYNDDYTGPDKFGNKMQELYNLLDTEKLSNFNDIINDNNIKYEDKFGYKINNICETCGLDSEYKDGKCIGCLEEEYIGTELYKNDYIILTKTKPALDHISFKYGDKEIFYSFANNIYKNSENIKINSFNIKDMEIKNNLRFLLQAKYVVKENNAIKSINTLIDENDKHKMLAVVKGDVDNMGMLIATGFNNLTISRLASLSFEFEYFFSVKLDKIAGDSNVYVIYSGGDDLTIMGKIEDVIKFIDEFKSEFNDYFKNPDITISMGVTINDPKFPLRRSIVNAEENLEEAKRNGDKNSITFVNTMKWNDYEKMKNTGEYLYKNKNISQGFIYLLNRLEKHVNKKIVKGTVINTSYNLAYEDAVYPDPLVFYYLRRNIADKQALKDITDYLFKNIDWKYMDFITSYAVIKNRIDKNNGGK